MQKTKTKLIKYLLKTASLFIIVLCYSIANSATLSLSPSTGSYNVGDSISMRVYVNSASESINAVSTALVFSNDTLALSSISKSGSIINYWAVDPKFVNSAGQASLDGVAISGFSGQSGTIVTLNFRAIAEGSAYVRFSNASVLANDGQGTDVLTGSNSASFSINKSQKIDNIEQGIIGNIIKKPETKIVTNQNTIKVDEIRSIRNASGRTSFLIIAPRPIKDKTYNIQIDAEENFSYIDDGYGIYQTDILSSGNHTIRVSAIDTRGAQMTGINEFTILPEGTSPIEFAVKNGLSQEFAKSPDAFTTKILIGLAALIVILIIGFIRIRLAKKALNKNIKEIKKTVSKAFNILEEDEDEENKLIRKLKNRKVLTDDDEASINQFSKDLSEAEKIINERLNELSDD
ncbi:MAG: Cohesin protein [Bacteroidota bacterium]|nr:Cohesin protein [Bacteroidota bacterium]